MDPWKIHTRFATTNLRSSTSAKPASCSTTPILTSMKVRQLPLSDRISVVMGPTVANRRASWEPNPYCKVSAGSVTTLQNGGSITTTRGSRHPTRHSDAKDIRASPVLGRCRRTNGTQACQRHARNTQLSRRKRILGHSTNVLWQRSSVILNLDRLHLLRAVVLLLSRDSLLVLSQRRPSQRQTPIATPMVSTREGPSSLTRSEASLIHRLKSSGSSKTPTPLVVCGTLLGPSAEYPRLVRPAE